MDDTPEILLFDDARGDLGPLSDLRASFEQRTGGLTLLERCRAISQRVHVAVPEALEPVVRERLGEPQAARGSVLCLNGRLHADPDLSTRGAFGALGVGHALVAADGSLVAARLEGAAVEAFVAAVEAGSATFPGGCRTSATELPLWTRPWHLLDAARLGALLDADARAVSREWQRSGKGAALPQHAASVGSHPVLVHPEAQVGVGVVLDASAGPICVGPGAQVGHGSVVQGPAWIGPRSIVAPRSLLKERTVLGPQCRAAGEIGSAIFQGCSNKAHDGHLGDALLGEWVNLGAGTVNSNLLNTYGEVTMRLRPSASMERTGRQFMGCVIGDHAKTAIGTRIMTGSSVGTGAMWAAGKAVSGAVAPFAWVTDDGERRFRLDKFLEIAGTVMARRGMSPGTAVAARLTALHAAAGS
jgi:UDP-N-acetylglucosamine diphosphorylase/glucosamine-1-phosphate N-acetyltransferase